MLMDEKIRGSFRVAVLTEPALVGSTLKTYLSIAGYQAIWYKQESDYIEAEKRQAHHLLILDARINPKLRSLWQTLLELNAELSILVLGAPKMAIKLEAYRTYNFKGLVALGEGMEALALISLDQAAIELYYRYQNEQLLRDQKTQVQQLSEQSLKWQNQAQHFQKKWEMEVQQWQQQWQQEKAFKEQLLWLSRLRFEALEKKWAQQKGRDAISIFLEYLQESLNPFTLTGYYFKYLPTVNTFVLVQQQGQYRQLSFRPTQLPLVTDPLDADLKDLIEVGLGYSNFSIYPIANAAETDGFFCFPLPDKDRSWIQKKLDLECRFFNQLFFQSKQTVKSLGLKEDIDTVTQLPNQRVYWERLNSEWSRTQRLKHPLSLIKIAIDHSAEISRIHSSKMLDVLWAQVAALILHSGRVNDGAFRTGPNEVTLILPHTPIKGAALRAERLRRSIEHHDFHSYAPGHITVSFGLSEYPNLASSFAELDTTASQALSFIIQKATNRVCLYQAESDV